MNYAGTLIAVRDMEKSKRFYRDVLGLNVTADFGANVTLEGGIFLQTLATWREFIRGRDVCLRHNAAEFYFETEDMDAFLENLAGQAVEYVHAPLEHAWGQRVVRFYEPDGHIIEVGEAMTRVVRRFKDAGMTDEQVAARMDVPLDYVKGCLEPEV